jgi:hypothetical protein
MMMMIQRGIRMMMRLFSSSFLFLSESSSS